jgi:hypothetical protein
MREARGSLPLAGEANGAGVTALSEYVDALAKSLDGTRRHRQKNQKRATLHEKLTLRADDCSPLPLATPLFLTSGWK